ncbi:Xaa-Pro dipeptidase [Marinomonas sp. M1K-6]|uniref:Xaa-Pro dipeptidase n=1 Tax=Marinomonas profundi TaxID=2726122 RepID=A0A847R1T0_9GAMM|nr:Xaa-Pro dipeptidase [Marinomonas profundi]NLQ17731.1 Xaa-Pro dipeptidase [Marinomonas profundi]UDV04288.1 Xaa-Pro dipeptidase [Marinomonas profundi]
MSPSMTTLYQQHLVILTTRYDNAMAHFGLDAIVLASGEKSYYFQDDHTHPFHAYSGAQQWLPFTLGADTYIVLQAGKKPTLVWPVRDDFWHAPNPVPSGDWQANWDIVSAKKTDQWCVGLPKQTAWLGPNAMPFAVACEGLKAYVDFAKAVKTDFEIHAMRQANLRGAAGHMAAKEAFLAGTSELEIHLAFLNASQQSAFQEPYPGIVGLNEHAAVLHYEHKSTAKMPASRTLLIDAGANEHGYASDITRTFTRHNDDFRALVNDLDAMEQTLCRSALSGVSFRDLHQETLVGIATLLHQHKICSLSVEAQLAKRIPQVFFPHGLGHLLGLQVHDVGGHQIDQAGTLSLPDEQAPFLRLTRTLEQNMVITIEPGVYFIPMLIDKMQAEINNHGCDMARIAHFMPYGGIRIEDNIVVKHDRPENLTREAGFSQLSPEAFGSH